MRRIVRLREGGRFELDTAYFRHHREKIDYAWEGGSPHVGTLFSPALEELLGPARSKDEPLADAIAISRAPPRRCTRKPSSILWRTSTRGTGSTVWRWRAAAP